MEEYSLKYIKSKYILKEIAGYLIKNNSDKLIKKIK